MPSYNDQIQETHGDPGNPKSVSDIINGYCRFRQSQGIIPRVGSIADMQLQLAASLEEVVPGSFADMIYNRVGERPFPVLNPDGVY